MLPFDPPFIHPSFDFPREKTTESKLVTAYGGREGDGKRKTASEQINLFFLAYIVRIWKRVYAFGG